ncbi:hypothetical protein NDU88_005957 [Pleurodeles waltl]|uniref:Uncharacterized protein n=1 Tax=Pleurodeles waltl TaxID=8319 RepID=A0AAV7LMS2_PLEWA|nr:hypothetical protein NDU88_005957 [Pleurodeles waltl]
MTAEIACAFTAYLGDKYSSQLDLGSTQTMDRFLHIILVPQLGKATDKSLKGDILEGEIADALSRLKYGKTQGRNGLLLEFSRHVRRHVVKPI